jgi:hypothetical protein
MYIAPGIHRDEWIKLQLDDETSLDWNRAIEIFNERIGSRYLEPVDLLIEDDEKRKPIERRYGFSILAIDCLLIETLQSFREGLTDTKNKSRKMFKKFLTSREGFREHFNPVQAKSFFYDFRCGILHQGEVMGPSLLWSVGLLKGEKADGTPYINRTKVHEYVKEEVKRYSEELRDPANSELRRKFRIKMDFIARKEDMA